MVKETLNPGNVNLIYPIRDSLRFVDGVEGYNEQTYKNERKDLQLKAKSLLWAVRKNPEYWGHERASSELVANLLGIVGDSQELERFETSPWRSEAESPKSTTYRAFDVQCETVHIPHPNENAKKGLQTDIIVACSEIIRKEVMTQDYMLEKIKKYAARLEIPVDEAIKQKLGIWNYNLFFPTYLFPLVDDKTSSAAQIVWENPKPYPGELKRRSIIDIIDPVEFSEKEFGLKLDL